MPPIPGEFPNITCWAPRMRAEVMNTIALDVDEAVFKATHFPSFVQQQGARRGTFVRLSESEFLDDFLNEDHVHVFNIAVGDPGTGKSHLIRWMFHETLRRNPHVAARYWVVLVPRSSANLAEVVRKILHGFDGEITTRLIEELERHRSLPLNEVKNRVIDELAYVLETNDKGLYPSVHERTAEETEILKDLPALLRAQELRRSLVDRPSGIVTRLARHVLGRREDLSEELSLHWTPNDLKFGIRESERAGKDAADLALMLLEDDQARETAAEFLNRAQPNALKSLLRFKAGDMKAALAEIRHDLLGKGKELVLLIEDLSVTEGLDAELIEALQVRTRDTGEELCRLRSIIGVTTDDYARMRENIAEGRTLRTVFFNMTLGGGSDDGSVEPGSVLDLASRYLNAARHLMPELKEWYQSADDETLPSVCDTCPNLTPCHQSFGEVDGRGLYPLSPDAILRLYDRVASGRGESEKAFNPRLLVGRVLNGVLEEAEQSIQPGTFPRASLNSSFGLGGVQADVEIQLHEQFGLAADRLQRAIDLYSPDPASQTPVLRPGISRAFALPDVTAPQEQPAKTETKPTPSRLMKKSLARDRQRDPPVLPCSRRF